MVKKVPLIGSRLSKRKKIPQPKLIRSGFRVLRKSTRTFNGKRYNRLLSVKSKERADKIKDKFRNKGYHALIIESGPNYQIWIRKGEK